MKKTIVQNVTVDPAWFKKWFNSSFYHQLYAKRDEKEAAGFIDTLLDELQPRPDAYMLDVGCGGGRHSKHLASKGFNVTGIDLAGASIRQAKKFETPALNFYRHDMRNSFGKNYFDYVFNFFTSFGYFKNDKENDIVISNITASLKDNGMLMMDYLNVQYAEERSVAEEEKEIDGIIYQISRWSDDRFFYKRIMIDESTQFTEQVAKFSVNDFEKMFGCAGLKLEKVFGDYELNSYHSKSSPRLILIAKKLSSII